MLCTRRPVQTLTVQMPDGEVRVKARNVTDPAQAEAVDWVIVATKTYDAEGAAAWFPGLCAKGAPVASGAERRGASRAVCPLLSAGAAAAGGHRLSHRAAGRRQRECARRDSNEGGRFGNWEEICRVSLWEPRRR